MGFNSSSSSSHPFEKWALPLFKDQVLPYTQGLLKNYDPTGGPDRAASMNYYRTTLNTPYDPNNNPTLAPVASAIARSQQEFLDKNIGRINTGAQSNGTLVSTGTGAARATATRQAAADLTDRMSNLYAGDYAANQQRKDAAAGSLLNGSQMDFNQLMQFFNVLKGGTSASSGFGIGL